MRCSHEAQLYESNCFITLTFAPEHIPDDWSLDTRVFQLFMKKLRKRFQGLSPVLDKETGETTYPIRFYHCGEYGEICKSCFLSKKYCQCETFDPQLGRPHYHALLFNFDFPDKILHQVTRNGDNLYTSAELSKLWPYGHALIGTANFQSAAYVARYIMKKINGDLAEDHYTCINPTTGEIASRKPEYTTMSRRPGIGRNWLEKYTSDVYPADAVIVKGKKMKPPKYYDIQYEIMEPDIYATLKAKRLKEAKKHVDNNTPERLQTRLKVLLSKISTLHRKIHNDT